MLNKKLFLFVMREYGDTRESLAKALRITPFSLGEKIDQRNEASLSASQRRRIKARYQLSDLEALALFFGADIS